MIVESLSWLGWSRRSGGKTCSWRREEEQVEVLRVQMTKQLKFQPIQLGAVGGEERWRSRSTEVQGGPTSGLVERGGLLCGQVTTN